PTRRSSDLLHGRVTAIGGDPPITAFFVSNPVHPIGLNTLISGRLGDWHATPEHRHGRFTPSGRGLAIGTTPLVTSNLLGQGHHRLRAVRIGSIRSHLNVCN